MKRRPALWAIALSAFLAIQAREATASAWANGGTPASAVPMEIGTVDFEITCAPRVRADFNRGVALLHSFWQDQAFLAFQRVRSSDPECAIAYWGEAMTHFHQLLASPTPADVAAGAAELAQADRAREKSAREAAYIQALGRFFDGYRADDYVQHATAYADAMAGIAKTYPRDVEAQVFYALALLASDPPNDVQLANPEKAVAILQPLFRAHPDHPGIAHYIIHACDNPRMAREGLSAARHYAQIAPQVPHALHMPAHIFARLGLWREDIASNLSSKAAAEAAGRHHAAENRLHAMEFLEYAYLQTGRFDEARAIVTEAKTVRPTDVDPRYPGMWATVEARYPALLAIETRNWPMAAHLDAIAGGGSSSQEATLLAHAEAAAYLHDREAAGDTLHRVDSLTAEGSWKKGSSGDVEIRAWVDFARGDLQAAATLLRPLAESQATIGKGEVEIPAREMLADMLLLGGRPAAALAQYRRSLASDPNRFNALLGAGQAAEKLGRNRLAASYYRTLLANSEGADGAALEELRHARTISARWRVTPAL